MEQVALLAALLSERRYEVALKTSQQHWQYGLGNMGWDDSNCSSV
jgi:hypothetical protein